MSPRGSHLHLKAINHRYRFRAPLVLKDVSLTIEPGQRVALIGRSGCGKSTLLQLMSGLVRPTSGSVHINGTMVKGPSPKWNVMFQKPSLYPWMSVEKNAMLGCLIAGEAESGKARVAKLLKMVGIADLAQANVQRLSGGQQQRVALARSLATEPELLLLDEPFAALDEVTRAAMQKDVLRITAQLEITQVLVTHDIDEAVAMAQRIVVMSSDPGRIVADLINDGHSIDDLKHQIRTHLRGNVGESGTNPAQADSQNIDQHKSQSSAMTPSAATDAFTQQATL